MFAYPEPVVFQEAGTVVDPYSGRSVKSDWDNPTVVLTEECGVAPGNTAEPVTDARNQVDAEYDLIFDHVVTVDRTWRVMVRGEQFNVVGKPHVWRSPFSGWNAGTVVQVGRSEG